MCPGEVIVTTGSGLGNHVAIPKCMTSDSDNLE